MRNNQHVSTSERQHVSDKMMRVTSKSRILWNHRLMISFGRQPHYNHRNSDYDSCSNNNCSTCSNCNKYINRKNRNKYKYKYTLHNSFAGSRDVAERFRIVIRKLLHAWFNSSSVEWSQGGGNYAPSCNPSSFLE